MLTLEGELRSSELYIREDGSLGFLHDVKLDYYIALRIMNRLAEDSLIISSFKRPDGDYPPHIKKEISHLVGSQFRRPDGSYLPGIADVVDIIVDLNRLDPIIQAEMACMVYSAGFQASAIKQIIRLRNQFPGQCDDHYEWVLYPRGKLREATSLDREERVLLGSQISELEAKFDPSNPDHYCELAQMYYEFRDRPRAIDILQKANKLFPQNDKVISYYDNLAHARY